MSGKSFKSHVRKNECRILRGDVCVKNCFIICESWLLSNRIKSAHHPAKILACLYELNFLEGVIMRFTSSSLISDIIFPLCKSSTYFSSISKRSFCFQNLQICTYFQSSYISQFLGCGILFHSFVSHKNQSQRCNINYNMWSASGFFIV